MPKLPRKPNEALRRAREERGWTQSEAATALGFSLEAVQSWERGRRNPGPKQQAKLCDVYQRSPEELDLRQRLSIQNPLDAAPSVPSERESALMETSEQEQPQEDLTHPAEEDPLHVGLFLHQPCEDAYRLRMLRRVQRLWVEGVLKRKLRQIEPIPLNLMELPEALENPWLPAIQETNEIAQDLPPGTSIMQIYDIADGTLLILGEAGAGKTTLLLQLACELLKRAEKNRDYPIPVVFHLSFWTAKHTSFVDWLIEELQNKYDIPEVVGQAWIETNKLAILLDGLDEMSNEARPACMKAIVKYHQEHKLASLVMCCRKNKYFEQPTHMAFQRAILIQPLTREQMHRYLSSTRGQIEMMQKALGEDPELEEMIRTPLMLGIVAQTYQGYDSIILTGSKEERRRQIFKLYVQRMLSRRRGAQYPLHQTIHWLSWLANQMKSHDQTIFYLERMQPDWLLDGRLRQCYRRMIVRLIFGFQIFIVAGLFAWLRGGEQANIIGVGLGLFGTLGGEPGNKILGWMAPGLGGGLEGGGSLGLILALVTVLVTLLVSTSLPTISLQALRYGLLRGGWNGLKIGVSVGMISGLIFGLSGGPGNGLYRGSGAGLFSGLLVGLMIGLIAILRYERDSLQGYPAEPNRERLHSILNEKFTNRLVDFVIFSLCGGLGCGGVYTLLVGQLTQNVVVYGSIVGLFFGIAFGFGGGTDLIRDLGTEILPAEIVAWSWDNISQNLPGTVRKGLLVALAVTVSVVVIIGCASGLFYGAGYGFRYGLVYGPIVGLVGGVAGILTGVLNSGWSSNILDDHRSFQPNEGIHRSIRNAAFAASLFGPLGGLASGLVSGLAFGFVGGLSGWHILGMGFGLAFGIIFALQFAMIHGGIAYIEHYILRWYLWRTGSLPWNYISFLDYADERVLLSKVEGGYMFYHQLLHDYFVTPDTISPSDKNVPS